MVNRLHTDIVKAGYLAVRLAFILNTLLIIYMTLESWWAKATTFQKSTDSKLHRVTSKIVRYTSGFV